MKHFLLTMGSTTNAFSEVTNLSVPDDQSVEKFAEAHAKSYGATVVSVEPLEPVKLLRSALRESMGFVEAWSCHLDDSGRTTASKTVKAVHETMQSAYNVTLSHEIGYVEDAKERAEVVAWLREIESTLKSHPDFAVGNSKIHYVAHKTAGLLSRML